MTEKPDVFDKSLLEIWNKEHSTKENFDKKY